MPEDMRVRLGGSCNGRAAAPRFSPARFGNSNSPQTLVKRAADLASIFVGDLLPGTTEDMLREVFGKHGRIVQIEIIRKPSVNSKHTSDLACSQI